MRLWSLHPQYLDVAGLVAVWREGLLAHKVLRGETRGYRHHPQLWRFRQEADPLAAIAAYLEPLWAEATRLSLCAGQDRHRPHQHALGGDARTTVLRVGALVGQGAAPRARVVYIPLGHPYPASPPLVLRHGRGERRVGARALMGIHQTLELAALSP